MPDLRVCFDRADRNKLPYGRMAGQRFYVAVSDGNLHAPWHEVPLDSFQVVVPMHDLDPGSAKAFVRSRLSALEEDGCVMVRYEPASDGRIPLGLAFAPGVREMGVQASRTDRPDDVVDQSVEGTVDELVEHVVGMAVTSDVMAS